jgi:two-component system NarL family response regulator
MSTPVKSPIRVLLAEDHAIVREGLAALLAMHPDVDVVGQAEDGAAALELYRRLRPDVAVVDLRMPRLSGAALIKQLRQEFAGARFVVLTTYDTDEEIFQALQAGAQAYLLKGARTGELVDAIKAVHAGARRIPADVSRRAFERSVEPALTARERELLTLMARGHSNVEIATALGISEHTVKNHTASIFGKLGVGDRTRAVLVGLERGLVKLGE